MGTRVRLAGVLFAGGAVLLTGCTGTEAVRSPGGSGTVPPASVGAASAAAPSASGFAQGPATTPAVPSGSPSGAPSGAPTVTPGARPTLKPGAKGEAVRTLQERLRELRYDPGRIDGRYGPGTQLAVWAFQKVNRLKHSGTVGGRFWRALDAPRPPKGLTRDRGKARVDIDLRRQLLVVYKGGEVALISHISSGSGEYYCAKDFGSDTPRCRYAVTSTGDFRTGRRVTGWDPSPLGRLYNPVYFNGGIAVHGYPSVPDHPASHGCVRVPMHTSELFQKLVGTGVPVHVRRPAERSR